MTDFFHKTLSSGLQLVGEEMPGVQSAAFAFYVRAGAREESWDVAGLGHLTEATMFRGTESRSSRDLTNALDALGVGRGSSAGIEQTLFSGILLGDNLLEALDIFVDVLRNAAFPEEELEAVRELQLQEIRQRQDHPDRLVMDRARQFFYAGHGAGNDILGSPESVAGLTRDQVRTWKWDRYAPNTMLFSVAGRFQWDQVAERLDGLTSGWTTVNEPLDIPEPPINPAITVHQTEAAQENLCFVYPAVPYGDRDYYEAALTSMVLGGGMHSRLASEVREKRGLVYSVGSRFDGMEKSGLTRIYAGTRPDRARETVEVIHAELERLQASAVAEDELSRAKTKLKSRLVMSSESSGSRAMTIGRDWWYMRRYRTLREVSAAIDAVDVSGIRSYLDRTAPYRNLALLALGPLSAADLGLPEGSFQTSAAPA